MAPRSRVKELEAALAQLQDENTTLKNENATLKDENTMQKDEITALRRCAQKHLGMHWQEAVAAQVSVAKVECALLHELLLGHVSSDGHGRPRAEWSGACAQSWTHVAASRDGYSPTMVRIR